MISRRSFIGLLSGALYAASTPWTKTDYGGVPQISRAPERLGRIREVMIHAGDSPVLATVSRVGATQPILCLPTGPNWTMRHVLMPGDEIIMPEGIPSIVIDAPDSKWAIIWEDSLGYVRQDDSDGNSQMLMTPAMRSRANRTLMRRSLRGSGPFARYVEADAKIQASL